MSTSTKRLWIALGCLAAVVVVAFGGALLALGGGDDPDPPNPRDAARAYLSAWAGQRWRDLRAMTVGATAAAPAAYQAQLDQLGASRVEARLVSGRERAKSWTGRFTATLSIPDAGRVSYDGSLLLDRRRGAWKVVWSPATVHPKLPAGGSFAVERAFPPRAPILGVDSTPLTVDAEVVDVGLVPERIKDRVALEAALQRTLGLTPADVDAKLNAPGVQPNHFVLVTTIPVARYDEVDQEIYPLPGTAFRRRSSRTAATPQLGVHVVGRTGAVTAEILKELGPGYGATDVVGLSGLEREYETRLAGTAGRRFVIRDAAGTTVDTLKDVPGTPGQAVRTTIDLRTQQAAEAALGDTAPAAIVALQPSTGELRAIVSTPVSEEFDRALDGRYPPGSTFKIVTTAALLANGTTPNTATTCPPTFTIDGRAFRNFEGETEPSLTFARAFSISCNTAFLQLGEKLPDDALARAATTLGFDAKPDLPLASLGGSLPAPTSATERAAATIGQGKVTASPLAMAAVVGAVASGAWRPSKLILDPPPTGAAPPSRPLAAGTADALRSLMHSVVANGTGTSAAVDGRDVAGKTGTAEFGDGANPPTHAWFVGYSGDLAFSVLVEGGGVGGRVAAPLAAAFLAAAPR